MSKGRQVSRKAGIDYYCCTDFYSQFRPQLLYRCQGPFARSAILESKKMYYACLAFIAQPRLFCSMLHFSPSAR